MLPRITFVLATVALAASAAACATKDKRGHVPSTRSTSELVSQPSMVDPTNEAIGGVQLGDAAAKVVETFGEPTQQSELVEYAATGDRVSDWTWEGKGLELGMAEVNGGLLVHTILVKAPSTLTTSRGIGIGATFEQVDATYAPFRNQGREEGEPEQWDAENGITVGSVYGGTMFTFEAGKVSQIFVGAAAE